MKFMIQRKADANTEAGVMPTEELLSAMARYNEELAKAGILIGGEGLQPSSKGAKIKFSAGLPSVTDGPFAETKELTAGYTMIQVDSREEAIEWAKRWPALDADGNVELELRQVFELEDFEQNAGLERHRTLSERLARRPSLMNTYLTFNGQCREAFAFYADCLGGDIEFMMSHGEAPGAQTSADWRDKILHAQLRIGNWVLMGADMQTCYQKPQGFAVQMGIEDPEQAARAFEQLAQQGEIQMPFAETFWAYRFGMLTDRYGIPWMINCTCAKS